MYVFRIVWITFCSILYLYDGSCYTNIKVKPMTKKWKTKSEILKLLKKKPMTVSEISSNLKLAVSTASQHVSELEEAGAIEEMELGHIKKWRYYKLNPSFNPNLISEENIGRSYKKTIAFVVILAAAGIIFLSLGISFAGRPNKALLFSLTDPPAVPNGTQALLINYSSMEISVIWPNKTSTWEEEPGSGTLNLLTLKNSSQIISVTKSTGNGIVNGVRFNINSARIKINGTMYNVSIPNEQVSANINPPARLNLDNQVLIDLFPSVFAVYNRSSTEFVMIVSVEATTQNSNGPMFIGKVNMLNRTEFVNLTKSVDGSLSGINLSVTNFKGNKNNINLSLNLYNGKNGSVIIKHIIILGNMSVSFNLNGTYRNYTVVNNGSQDNNSVWRGNQNFWENGQGWRFGMPPPGRSITMNPGVMPGRMQMMSFMVSQNGNLETQHSIMQEFNSGYILNADSGANFSFEGNLSFENGRISISLIPNSTYKIVVLGYESGSEQCSMYVIKEAKLTN